MPSKKRPAWTPPMPTLLIISAMTTIRRSTIRKMKVLKALALFLVFCFAQVYVQAGLGNPGGGIPQGARLITARLTTRGGAALVNGVSTASGATILTGAAIETPDQVSATVDLG